MSYVFLGVPSRDERVPAWMVPAVLELSKKHTVQYAPVTCSVLEFSFDLLLCAARANPDADFFVLHHDDVHTQPDGIVKLVELMQTLKVGVLSATVPIKDSRGITSTALAPPDDEWAPVDRLTMKRIMELPETIFSDDFPDKILLINTGFMIIDMRQDFVKDICFEIKTKITTDADGKLQPLMISEDWAMSRDLHRWGVRYAATRAIPLAHRGASNFPNDRIWGELEVDNGGL